MKNTTQTTFTRDQLVEFMKALQYEVKIDRKPHGHSVVTFIEDHGVFKGQTHHALRWDKINPFSIAQIVMSEGYLREPIYEAISKVFKSRNLVNMEKTDEQY